MSEDHIYFRMICFHVNNPRFMVSAENFMKILPLTYDVIFSYEHDRQHVAACEDIPQSCNRMGAYIYHLAHYMFTPGCRFANVDQFNKFICIVVIMDLSATSSPTRSCRHVIFRPTTPHFSPVTNPHHISFWSAHHHG
jgi:hypothetical protein